MWLNRGKRPVFYLCQRINGQARQIRVGTGPYAEMVAAEVESRKQARVAAAEACAAWEVKAQATEQPLDDLCVSLELLATASLLALGFHRHDRSKWRKRHERREAQDE